MHKNIRSFIIGGFLASVGALAVNIPFTFSASTPIKASDINANFSSVKTAVDALENSRVQIDDTLKGNGTSANRLGVKFPIDVSQTTDAQMIRVRNRGTGPGIISITESNYSIFGTTNGGDGAFGVRGESTGPGLTGGVFGKADTSPIGTGVSGWGGVTGGYFEAKGDRAPGHDPVGVYGYALKRWGTGVIGSGHTWGGKFTGGIGLQVDGGTGIISRSTSGSTLILNQDGGGLLINGFLPNGRRFIVLNDGSIETSGSVTAQGVRLTSDRNAKTNFSRVNALEVLNKVTQLPVSRWNYKTDTASLQHVGPMAQDFHAAFGLNGSDDKHISVVDMQGVAIAAIQGLNQKLEQKSARIAELEQKLERLAQLEQSMAALELRLKTLEQQ